MWFGCGLLNQEPIIFNVVFHPLNPKCWLAVCVIRSTSQYLSKSMLHTSPSEMQCALVDVIFLGMCVL